MPSQEAGTFIGFAETARFELAIPFRVYTLSRRAPSTTRTRLPKNGWQKYSFASYQPNIFWALAVVIFAISSLGRPFTSASFSTMYFK